jgi:hypothetical protein
MVYENVIHRDMSLLALATRRTENPIPFFAEKGRGTARAHANWIWRLTNLAEAELVAWARNRYRVTIYFIAMTRLKSLSKICNQNIMIHCHLFAFVSGRFWQ